MTTVKMPIALLVTFLWIGFVSAISFLEAWLKFRAPGVTLPIGLGIGKLVFNTLNRVEWVFAVVILGNILRSKSKVINKTNLLYFLSLLLLVLQTVWVLPLLDDRADLYIQELTVAPSNLHFYFVGMEVIKVMCLCLFGISLLKSS